MPPQYRMALAVFLFTLTLCVEGLRDASPKHMDEVGWSRIGIEAVGRLAHGQWDDLWWLQSHGTFGVENPNIGKYITGGALYLAGIHDPAAVQWDDKTGILPITARVAARMPAALLFAAMVAAFYALCMMITGRLWLSLAAPALVLLHPWSLYHSTLAMLDTPALAFLVLAVAFLVYGLQKDTLWLALVGWLLAGLAISTKLNALLLVPTFFALYALHFAYTRKVRALEILAGCLIVAAVFVGSNPAVWQEPLVVNSIVSFGSAIAEKQEIHTGDALLTIQDKAAALWRFTVGGQWWGALLFVAGVGHLLYRRTFAAVGVLPAALIVIIGNTWWAPLEWTRYFYPPAVLFAFVQGTGVAGLLSLVPVYRPRPLALPRPYVLTALAVCILALLGVWWGRAAPRLDSSAYLARAEEYRAADIRGLARHYYRKAVETDTFAANGEKAEGYYLLARELSYSGGEGEEIIGLLEETTALNPKHYWALRLLGRYYYTARGDSEGAIATLERAIAANNKRTEAYLALADIYQEVDPAKACAIYGWVLELQPEHQEAQDALAACS